MKQRSMAFLFMNKEEIYVGTYIIISQDIIIVRIQFLVKDINMSLKKFMRTLVKTKKLKVYK